jgi:hypothetical protein
VRFCNDLVFTGVLFPWRLEDMKVGQIFSMVIATGVLCWLLIPIVGTMLLGAGAAGAVAGVSILLIWPLSMVLWHRNVKSNSAKAL